MEIINVSVVIPVYNAEKFLRACLDSATGQTLRETEILCIDDGSTDNSAAVVAQYMEIDPRIRLIRQENSGSGAARNRGIRAAQGKYIAFLDADDYYPEAETLEKLYRAAVQHDVRICGGSFSVVWPDGKVVTRFDSERYWGYTFEKDGLWEYRDYQFDFGYHRFLYRRDFLLKNRLFFPDYLRYQDPPFFVRAMTAAGSFYALRDVSYRYRIGTGTRGITVSRKKAWGQITTSKFAEAYRSIDILKKTGTHKGMTEILNSLSLSDAQQIADVTYFKASEMLNSTTFPRMAMVYEACRGTAKDMATKFLPALDARIKNLSALKSAGKGFGKGEARELERLVKAREYYGKLYETYNAIGKHKLPPEKWDEEIRLMTGGEGILGSINNMGDLFKSLVF